MMSLTPDLQVMLMNHTISEVARHDYAPSLAIVRQAYGEQVLTDWLAIQLAKFLAYANASKEITKAQLFECAQAIAVQYYYLNVYEVCQFFGLCRTARYGGFYGAPTAMQVMEMLQKHVKARNMELDKWERLMTAERISQQTENINGYTAYLNELRTRAEHGDEEAIAILKKHKKNG